MPEVNFPKNNIPLWTGATGSLDVEIDVADPTQPLDRKAANPITKASFDVKGANKGTFGATGTLNVSFDANTSVALGPIWNGNSAAAADLDKEFGISAKLDANTVAVTLDLGVTGKLSASGSFSYNALSVTATVDANADARFVAVRPYPADRPLVRIPDGLLDDFLANLHLPGTLQQAPAPGELYSLELGGSLKLGINAAAGYEIKGTQSFNLNDLVKSFSSLQLSESYDLSILGKLGGTAEIDGRFSIQASAGANPGWVNVQVFRKRTTDLQFAADLKVSASSNLQGLPSGKEFLGALLGVNAKNWLNLVDSVATQAGQITTVAALKTKLDGLADIYISKYANKAIDTILDGTQAATDLLNRLNSVVTSYENLSSDAIALFDRYYDASTQTVQGALTNALKQIGALRSLKELAGTVDPTVWNVLQQLTSGITGGDVVTAILQDPIAEIQKKVADLTNLIQSDAHTEIRSFISIAKSDLGLDPLFNQIAQFDSVDTLKIAASNEVQHLIQRITNQWPFDTIATNALQPILDLAKKFSDASAAFWTSFDSALSEASSQAISLEINALWESSSETDALVNVDINLNDPAGPGLLKEAGSGDFTRILGDYNPGVVLLNSGKLTHNLKSYSGVKINVVGWHLNYQYESSYTVLTQADQRILPTSTGRINVFTTIDMQALKNKQRQTTQAEETLYTCFTLRLLAESANLAPGDAQRLAYLYDVVTGVDASYQMTFTDTNTTPAKLEAALDFAAVLGLDKYGANLASLQPVLQKDPSGNYGAIQAEYQVMFTKAGLMHLFAADFDGNTIRGILKPIVIANYYNQGNLAIVGWMYVNDSVKSVWDADPIDFVTAGSVLQGKADSLQPETPIPGINPPVPYYDASTDITYRQLTASLYLTEQNLIDGFTKLAGLVKQAQANPAHPVANSDLVDAVNQFGKALNSFDSRALGDNTTFAVIDGLIKQADLGTETRASALDLLLGPAGSSQRHVVFQISAN
jgi:hypothetical protein